MVGPSTPPAQLLRLHAADNVLTALSPIAPGRKVDIEGESVTMASVIPLGHKVAARTIAAGAKVMKYGVPIGSATCEIARGQHVHTHNVRSDYLPTPGGEAGDSGNRAERDSQPQAARRGAAAAASIPGFRDSGNGKNLEKQAEGGPDGAPPIEAAAASDRRIPESRNPEPSGANRSAAEIASQTSSPALRGKQPAEGCQPGRDGGREQIPESLLGYLRPDGRKGIRNVILVVYLVECAHHVAREIVYPSRSQGVHLLGFPGCYPNDYAHRMLRQLCTHPNVGAVLLVSLGCEGFNRGELLREIRASGRPAEVLVIQQEGGTRKTINEGLAWVAGAREQLVSTPRAPMRIDELIVGTICGGSDATSGITANPAVGRAFDRLVADGARVIFEETGELIGCERIMAARAARPELGPELVTCVEKAARYYTTMGHGSFAPGNAEGGLTTQEEKSMGAYSKSGNAPISGILKPGDIPGRPGLFLLDVVPDGDVRWGFPNISDIQEIGELIACGAHLTLFTTGRGSVVGSAISPVIKICANPETYRRLSEDMDVNAGRILEGAAELEEIGIEIYEYLLNIAAGRQTASETLGHQEFSLVYKSFEPIGPACFPS